MTTLILNRLPQTHTHILQEPINAHSHLLSMALGNTLTIPITGGKLALGTWQSVLLVDLDGPRTRTVGVQVVGTGSAGDGQ
jgi:secondary thiamine-phosphate synthase enzyme